MKIIIIGNNNNNNNAKADGDFPLSRCRCLFPLLQNARCQLPSQRRTGDTDWGGGLGKGLGAFLSFLFPVFQSFVPPAQPLPSPGAGGRVTWEGAPERAGGGWDGVGAPAPPRDPPGAWGGANNPKGAGSAPGAAGREVAASPLPQGLWKFVLCAVNG